MEFSKLFKVTSHFIKFSPNGEYIASAINNKIIIKKYPSMENLTCFTCLDVVQCLLWSPDSSLVLSASFKKHIIQVWNVEEPNWKCKIDEGSAGLIDVYWSPDSRHILVTAEFYIQITLWSLVSKSVSYIKHPKDCVNYISFSKNGCYMALVERRRTREGANHLTLEVMKDYISIFDTDTWSQRCHFETATVDLTGIQWNYDSTMITVWENVFVYKVLQYRLDGQPIHTFSARDYSFGLKSLSLDSGNLFIALGSYDQKVELLNILHMKSVIEFSHHSTIDADKFIVLKELKTFPSVNESCLGTVLPCHALPRYEQLSGTVVLPAIKYDMSDANPKVGIGKLAFSSDSQYLYSRNDNQPCVVYVWDIYKLRLAAVLIQETAVRTISWDPVSSRLAFCTNTPQVYLWTPDDTYIYDTPGEQLFNVVNLSWNHNGSSLILIGRDHACVAKIGNFKDNSLPEDHCINNLSQ